jgi:hypothetical protein
MKWIVKSTPTGVAVEVAITVIGLVASCLLKKK